MRSCFVRIAQKVMNAFGPITIWGATLMALPGFILLLPALGFILIAEWFEPKIGKFLGRVYNPSWDRCY